MMAEMPWYPGDDDIAYLSWFDGRYDSIFVGLTPFTGPDGPVSWRKIGDLCGFATLARVNRALRQTGSRRTRPELCSPADTARLLAVCARERIQCPHEGRPSPLLAPNLAQFLAAHGPGPWHAIEHFPTNDDDCRPLDPSELYKQSYIPPQIFGTGLYITMYTDFFYFLVCQTTDAADRVDPARYFEGFVADSRTDDSWGIGAMPDDTA